MKDREPISDYMRYAYGYSDKKPSKGFFVLLGLMVLYVLYNMITIQF